MNPTWHSIVFVGVIVFFFSLYVCVRVSALNMENKLRVFYTECERFSIALDRIYCTENFQKANTELVNNLFSAQSFATYCTNRGYVEGFICKYISAADVLSNLKKIEDPMKKDDQSSPTYMLSTGFFIYGYNAALISYIDFSPIQLCCIGYKPYAVFNDDVETLLIDHIFGNPSKQ